MERLRSGVFSPGMGQSSVAISSSLFVPPMLAAAAISTILVHAGSSSCSETLVREAADLANRFGARLFGLTTTPSLAGDADLDVTAAEERAAEMIVQAAGERFAALAGAVRAGARWRPAEGPPAAALARLASAADLIMTNIRVPAEGGGHDESLKALVIDGGRPVLVRPPAAQGVEFQRIAVLWDRSAACGRAIAAALPFMGQAERTTLILDPHHAGPGAADRVDDLREGLALRGLDVQVTAVEHGRDRSHHAVAQSLSADLLVMSGWRRHTPWLGFTDDTDAVIAGLESYALISH